MARDAMMPGPDGTEVRAFYRTARQVRAGDWLPDHHAHALADALLDPDDGTVWVPLEGGRDLHLTTRKVWLHRRYSAPAWIAEAVAAYRAARDAREALRESGDPAPTGIAGASGSGVAWYQLEPADFNAAYPPPRLADFLREAASARREDR
jgi:hypothetical protein